MNPLVETIGEFISRLEQLEELDPNCKTCKKIFYPEYLKGNRNIFAPRHKASDRCRSGKNPHCTCDTCF